MNVLWITLAVILLLVLLGGVAFLWYLRQTLLSGIAVVDVNEVDPAVQRQIEKLELDYAVAEELGYDGNILLGIESQLNKAKEQAAGNPDATLIVLVTPPSRSPEVAYSQTSPVFASVMHTASTVSHSLGTLCAPIWVGETVPGTQPTPSS